MVDELSFQARKGRGAVSNRSGRFDQVAVPVDDGWAGCGGDEEDLPPLRTTLTAERTRRIITHNDSPDVGFDRSINPYKGCEHGCVYCFARPTHAYLGLSPGLDFETRLFYKPDAARLLAAELRAKSYQPRVIALGMNTDAYQPAERTLKITRSILQVLSDFNHPVGLITKSALILRDLDILAPMAARGLVSLAVSLTTLDRDLARTMEPRAATPMRRIDVIRQMTAAGVPVSVMTAPMILGLNDHELERLLETAAGAGAHAAGYVMLRLPLEIAGLFEEWLREHVPGRAGHVLSLIRDARGGSLYQSEFGTRMRGTGPLADLLQQRFTLACRRLDLNKRRRSLDISQFRAPPQPGDQLSLL